MNKYSLIALIVGLLLIVASFFVGRCTKHLPPYQEVSDTVTVYDTHKYLQPIPFKVNPITPLNLPPIALIPVQTTDTLVVYDTLRFEQKVYKDSLYEAWVSGFSPSLDSIKVVSKESVITKTQLVPYQKPIHHSVYLTTDLLFNKTTVFNISAGYTYRWSCLDVGAGIVYQPFNKTVYGDIKLGISFGW